jgi:cephalosporin hydroxylase
MKTLEEIYNQKCNDIHSDIVEHLPTLKRYAEECEHITEMGVRWVVSTYALMMGRPKKLISIDIDSVEKHGTRISDLVQLGKSVNTNFNFVIGDTRKIEIEETDLLFIDTLHNYNQLKIELDLHGNKAKKYLIFHDTTLFEYRDEMPDGVQTPGLWPAIEEFLEKNKQWEILERYRNNCGLTILKRK